MIRRLVAFLARHVAQPGGVGWACSICGEESPTDLTREQALHEVRAHALLRHQPAPTGVDPLS